MELNLEQYWPQLIQSSDGVLHLACSAMQDQQPDIETYPRLSPMLRAPQLGDDTDDLLVDAWNAAAIRRLEHLLEMYGLQVPVDDNGMTLLGRANPVAVSPVHDFQVLWLGSLRQWLVGPGTVRWTELVHVTGVMTSRQHETGLTPLDGIDGWVVLPMTFSPETFDTGASFVSNPEGYTARVESPEIHPGGDPPASVFPKLTCTSIGVANQGGYREIRTWAPGRVLLQLARVEPPSATRRTPRIRQVLRGGLSFSPFWDGSLPNPTALLS